MDARGWREPGAPGAPGSAGAAAAAGCADQGQLIDVLVVYTPAALAEAGSTEALHAQFAHSTALANVAMKRSGLTLRLRLVGLEPIDYVESGNMALDLVRLRNPSDGHLDEAHVLRDQHGADLVSLQVGGGQFCGVAFIGTAPPDPTRCFSVLKCGGAVPAHEWGHSLGACHALGDDNGTGICDVLGGAFPFSRGWRFEAPDGTLYRTLMAYSPGTRILSYSSPLRTWLGVPTGDAALADNALTLDLMAPGVAAFRPASFIDCDGDGIDDACAILDGLAEDCNGNWIPDGCELAAGSSADLDCDGHPDECGLLLAPPPLSIPSLSSGDEAGSSIGLLGSGVGQHLVIGAPGADQGAEDAGAVFVLARGAEGWTLMQTLLAPRPAPFQRLGSALAIDPAAATDGSAPDEGAALLVGRPASLPGVGGAELFRLSGGHWQHEVTFDAPEPGLVDFGATVALRGDLLAIGAPGGLIGSFTGAGMVQLYRREEGAWIMAERLEAPAPAKADGFGRALGILADEGTPRIVVGAPLKDVVTLNDGAIFVFAQKEGRRRPRQPAEWVLEQTISSPAAEAFGYFGSALAGEGALLAIGAPEEQVLPAGDGTTHLFKASAGWGYQACEALVPSSAPAVDESATALALAPGIIVTGMPRDHAFGSRSGAAMIHRSIGGAWAPLLVMAEAPVEEARFGAALALQGSTLAIGAPGHTGGDRAGQVGRSGQGAVHVIELPAAWFAPGAAKGCPPTADLDGNGIVDAADLALLVAAWGECASCPADLDGDGVVEGADLGTLLAQWSTPERGPAAATADASATAPQQAAP
jgi:hypothetical protein